MLKKMLKQGKAPKAEAPKGAAPSPQKPLETVVTRNEFYRDGYRNIIRIAMLQGAAMVLLVVGLVVSLGLYEPNYRYFATTSDGRLIPMIPLDQPNMTKSALLSWSAQAAAEVMTFGFNDYTQQLQRASRHFTDRGWASFTSALEESRIIESVEERQQVATAVARAAPEILAEGIVGGVYRWRISLPLAVTYRTGAGTQTTSLQVTMVVSRVPTLDNPNGVGIEQWIAQAG